MKSKLTRLTHKAIQHLAVSLFFQLPPLNSARTPFLDCCLPSPALFHLANTDLRFMTWLKQYLLQEFFPDYFPPLLPLARLCSPFSELTQHPICASIKVPNVKYLFWTSTGSPNFFYTFFQGKDCAFYIYIYNKVLEKKGDP